MSSLVNGLTHLSGGLAYALVAALVFGETAIFLGFFLPGEAAVVLAGVLASRGQVSIGLLIAVVVSTAVAGPLVGYEIGRRMGERLWQVRLLSRIPGGVDKARTVLRERGGLGVLAGRFVAIVRALMPAVAGAAQVRYRSFLIYNMIGGIIWGVGYCLLGYLAGSAYTVVERRVGAGLAIVAAALVVAVATAWAVRRHRAGTRLPAGGPAAAAAGVPSASGPAAGPASGPAAAGEAPGGQFADPVQDSSTGPAAGRRRPLRRRV
ncbi:MAG TPA: DedA family protein [Streptosporangiaceae bacterium]